LALLEAIQHEFDTARNPQFFEDPKQIISHDLLRARGYTARHVALICYAMTVILVIAGWFIVRLGPWEAFVTSALVGCALFAIEVRAGALRLQDNSRHERAEEDLHWREMANGGGRNV
jgi:hypothetical protein